MKFCLPNPFDLDKTGLEGGDGERFQMTRAYLRLQSGRLRARSVFGLAGLVNPRSSERGRREAAAAGNWQLKQSTTLAARGPQISLWLEIVRLSVAVAKVFYTPLPHQNLQINCTACRGRRHSWCKHPAEEAIWSAPLEPIPTVCPLLETWTCSLLPDSIFRPTFEWNNAQFRSCVKPSNVPASKLYFK